MRLILIGAIGAGKGTQAGRLADRFGAPHVATGDLLRFSVVWETEIGLRAKQYMDQGELVPDEIVLELLRARLSQPDAVQGFILDGFPRNVAQADSLEATLAELDQSIDAIISLEVPDDVIVKRLSERASCPTCGRPFRIIGELDGATCDVDGTPLFRRKDDTPDVIRRRLQVFREQTEPLIAYYATKGCPVVRIQGNRPVEEVEAEIVKQLDELRQGQPR